MLTKEKLAGILEYNPATGEFIRIVGASNRVGTVAGARHPFGTQIYIEGKRYLAHRLAWLATHGRWPEDVIDHINHDPNDNRIANLREASRQQNQANLRRPKTNTSGFKGVKRRNHKWGAYIRIGGSSVFLGSHNMPEVAHAAYLAAAIFLHGEFACSG